ncbi:SDR family NAD(P)-dependent oxidoreductase [Nocardia otitidiscaviarum]|uniref:SDR family NAD(P)-dependent oxidoreductase n=1 Tax=Nocardia otitidiscaviarum TaxID=1823 RepID=A0A516NNP0_9NOCA|nr:SDR family NAD(P)-dependent oxidoreductase [Nocardia otitidiscaviarum]MCP9624240.1 SDR family NAD(P)-dependent oxidoreductase [Nocardia otitidiscaviarum]QDP80522.1 SDR family NAD(P)-dependent oxidoreductase [Nocardia otitidiscaviarum]
MTPAVVTGAASGIGRATALRLAKRGMTVIVADIDRHGGNETVGLVRAAGGRAEFRYLDIADADAWELFAVRVRQDHGVPELVVNNAGILISGGFLEQTGDDWRRMIAVNMMGPLWGSRVFVQQMVDAGVRGAIVNVCSVGAFLPNSLAPSYVTAKAGAWMGTQALRTEFAGRGIRVSAVCPGLIDTGLSANGTRAGADDLGTAEWAAKLARGQHLLGRSPDRGAAAVERAVRWNLSTVPVGIEGWAGWYLSRLSPGLLRGLAQLVRMPLAERVVHLSDRVLGAAR